MVIKLYFRFGVRIMSGLKISTRDMILVAMFAALIAVGAFIKIPVGPVPITLQLLFTTLAAVLLGWRLGALSTLVYLLIGLVGFPIFTGGGGISYVFNPTFGFLIAFIFGTALTGYLTEKMKKLSVIKLFAASYAGLGVIYLIGVSYFYFIMNFYLGKQISVYSSIMTCFVVFIPGDICKCLITSIAGVKLIPVLRKMNYINGSVKYSE